MINYNFKKNISYFRKCYHTLYKAGSQHSDLNSHDRKPGESQASGGGEGGGFGPFSIPPLKKKDCQAWRFCLYYIVKTIVFYL